ncbi:DUF397 domain-containing protein [Streptomyces sp. NPDC051569]|uniref:DUF397 domain-containing protein n=1 Tax=Streptomyces sp. NPDC051569 TaxID=3365661 RepID=UPI00378E2B47
MTTESVAGTRSELEWMKSTYSTGEHDSDCVEVAASAHTIHVRDSKQTGLTPLTVTPTAWAAFVTYAITGH